MIDPHTTKIIQVKPKKGRLVGKYIFTPLEQWNTYIPPVLVEFQCNLAHIPVDNINRFPLTINKMQILGYLTPVQDKVYELGDSSLNLMLFYFLASKPLENHMLAKYDVSESSDESQVNTITAADKLLLRKYPLYTITNMEIEENYDELVIDIIKLTLPCSIERIFLLTKHFIFNIYYMLPEPDKIAFINNIRAIYNDAKDETNICSIEHGNVNLIISITSSS